MELNSLTAISPVDGTYRVGLEYNLSGSLGRVFGRFPHSLKLFVDFYYGTMNYDIDYKTLYPVLKEGNNYDRLMAVDPKPAKQLSLTVMRINVGLAKDFYFFRKLRLTPYVNYTYAEEKFGKETTYIDNLTQEGNVINYHYYTFTKDSLYGKLGSFSGGANLSINIVPSVQFVLHVNALGVEYKPSNEATMPKTKKSGPEVGVYLRIEL